MRRRKLLIKWKGKQLRPEIVDKVDVYCCFNLITDKSHKILFLYFIDYRIQLIRIRLELIETDVEWICM